MNKLYFPANVSTTCNVLTVPASYITDGVIGDVGFIVGNENNPTAIYTAKSAACAFFESSKRSIWGVIIFNNAFLKYDQYGFQQMLFVGVIYSVISDRFMRQRISLDSVRKCTPLMLMEIH